MAGFNFSGQVSCHCPPYSLVALAVYLLKTTSPKNAVQCSMMAVQLDGQLVPN